VLVTAHVATPNPIYSAYLALFSDLAITFPQNQKLLTNRKSWLVGWIKLYPNNNNQLSTDAEKL
jgi:hypothetical protein